MAITCEAIPTDGSEAMSPPLWHVGVFLVSLHALHSMSIIQGLKPRPWVEEGPASLFRILSMYLELCGLCCMSGVACVLDLVAWRALPTPSAWPEVPGNEVS